MSKIIMHIASHCALLCKHSNWSSIHELLSDSAFSVSGPMAWNGLPVALRLTPLGHFALFLYGLKTRDVNKDLTPKDQDKDKDLTPKDQDKDKDLTPEEEDKYKDLTTKDKDKEKDLTPKDQDKDKDLKYVLKDKD